MHLIQPLTLSAITLPNRVVVAFDTQGAAPADYAQRAGAGLIVTPALDVERDAPEAWRAILRAVHAAGGRLAARLTHQGGDLPEQGAIPALIERFVSAASRARAAGFDAVEIDAGEGGLIDRFLNAPGKARRDAYGGSVRARARFLLEVAEAVAGIWGVERLGVRLTPWACATGHGRDPRETVAHVAAALDQIGIAWLHLVEPADLPRPLLPELRGHFGGAVIAGGQAAQAVSAQSLIAQGLADCAAFADLPPALA